MPLGVGSDIRAFTGRDAAVIRFKIENRGIVSERDFDGQQIRIGRAADNDLPLDDASVSAYHCRVAQTDAGWRLVGGEGETRLNGVPVREHRLHDGDGIDLGEVTLTFIDEIEREALTPDEASATPDGPPAQIVPDQVALAPPVPDSTDADPHRAVPSTAHGPTKTCPYCGNEIPEAATICRHCDEPLDRRARRGDRKRAGNWSLLSARATATRGVSFRQMTEWVSDGTINDNSSVSGPTTGFQWRFASETPRLSKYLGVCYRCGAPVTPNEEVCAACRINLDTPIDGEGDRAEMAGTRKGHLLRLAAAVSFLLAVVLGLGYVVVFTPAGRLILTETAQRRAREAVEALVAPARSASPAPRQSDPARP